MEATTSRIMVPMSPEEKVRLKAEAQAHMREPRIHARYLLRQALGFNAPAAGSPLGEPPSQLTVNQQTDAQ